MIKLLKKVTQINQPLNLPFSVDQESWYLILVSARVKSEQQVSQDSTDDQDLTVKIDNLTFPQLTDPNRLLDSLPLQWFYRFWYFVGSILLGKTTVAHFKTNLSKGLHYVELWTDRKPTVEKVEFDFGEIFKKPAALQEYKDERFGRDYNQLDQYILETTSFWNDFFVKQDYPPPQLLDPNLLKAIVYRESDLGYYPNENIIDVMQVWNEEDPAKPTLLGEKPESEFVNPNEVAFIHHTYPKDRMPPKVENREESIFWGIRWLYHKAQYLPNLEKPYVRKWLTWKEAVWNYNANPEIVEEYVREVFLVYEKGVDLDGNVLWKK